MDCFSLCLDILCLAGQGAMHMVFVSHATGKRLKIWHAASYTALLLLAQGLAVRLGLPELPSIGAELLLLYAMSRLALGNARPASCAAALIAVYISQLSFGLVNPVQSVLFPPLVGSRLLYPLVLLAALASLGICAGCYAAALGAVSLAEDGRTPFVWLLLCPGLFFFASELYILRSAYSALPPSPPQAGKHAALLALQALGLAALLCTLYAYRRLCRGLRERAELRVQETYLSQARARYERTRAFRHDVKNHLTVLDGLLGRGELEEGRAYLKKLEASSDALSFPYHTGSPAVDVLLGDKLGPAQAEGIAAEVSLCLPDSLGVDELDLCVIFANALDNALRACQAVRGPRSIRISGARQGGFYMLCFENTCLPGPPPAMGTGLSSIKAAAEKYRGAMLVEKTGGRFSLGVLLNIS